MNMLNRTLSFRPGLWLWLFLAPGLVADGPQASTGKTQPVVNAHPMKFGVLLDFASYVSPVRPPFGERFPPQHNRIARLLTYTPPEKTLFKYLESLYDTGAEIIRIDFYFDPWLLQHSPDAKQRRWAKERLPVFDRVVKKIRKDGKKLFIADAGAGYYATFGNKNHPLPWKEFREAQKKEIATLARRYKPEYYEIVKEYSWYSDWGMIKERPSAEEWAEQTEQLCGIVKKINPSTKVAIGLIVQSELDAAVAKRVVGSACLDIIGVDIYSDQDIEIVKQKHFSRSVHEHGKEAWLLETWTGFVGSYGEPQREQSDAAWIRKAAAFAREQGMDGFIPFFSSHFFFYDMPPGWETVSQEKLDDLFTRFFDAKLSERTAVFRAFRDSVQMKAAR